MNGSELYLWRAPMAGAFCCALLLAACAPEEPEGPFPPRRLALEMFNAREEQSQPPLVLPANESCRATMGVTKVRPGELEFRSLRPGSGFVIETDFDAADYNQLKVAIKASVGAECRLAWSSETEPADSDDWNYEDAPSVIVKLFPNSEYQTYTFDLGERGAPEWYGRIKRIFLAPSGERGVTYVRNLRFSREPTPAPRQIAESNNMLGEVSMDAIEGSPPPWKVKVPPHAVFETHIGMLPRAWKESFMGSVRFLVTLDTETESGIVLADRILRPAHVLEHRRWVPLRADLSKYAGQEITLHLTQDSLGLPLGDYAFWGAPTVYSEAPDPEGISVILISCDTLRADHLSCYGYGLETTPRLDLFAAEDAVLFENAIVPITWTLPSHMSMFTGLFPDHHRTTHTSNLPLSITTLPQILQENGYLTAGFTGVYWWMFAGRGFGRGMDYYNIPQIGFRHIYDTSHHVEKWLEEHPGPRKFLFFHNYDIHAKFSDTKPILPYSPDDPEFLVFSSKTYREGLFNNQSYFGSDLLVAQRNGQAILTEEQLAIMPLLYDDSIRMVDESLHEFFDKLKELGIYDNALIIVTSDHGETLMERGFFGHYTVNEEVCRVPMIIKFPKGEFAGKRFTTQVSTTDILATVLDAAGLPPVAGRDGHSLRQMLLGAKPPEAYTQIQRERERAVRTDGWKLIWNREQENSYQLFNLAEDPGEQNNLCTAETAQAATLRERLHELYADTGESWHLRLEIPGTDWRGSVLLEADGIQGETRDVETGVTLLYEPNPGENRLIIDSDVSGFDGLTFRTAATGEQIRLELTSETPFTVTLAGQTSEPTITFITVLDPNVRAYPQPAPAASLEQPRISLWYVPPKVSQEAAQAPDEATREQLKALGYL